MKFIKSKFKDDKAINEKTQIAAGDAAWITYSLNRKAGRGKLASWIIAVSVLSNFLYLKVIKKSNVDSLNTTIANSIKHPIWYVIGTFLARWAVTIVPIIALGFSIDNLNGTAAVVAGSAFGIALIARFIIDVIYGVCSSILLFTNSIRQNDDEKILNPMDEGYRFKEGSNLVKSDFGKEKVQAIATKLQAKLEKANLSTGKKSTKAIQSLMSQLGKPELDTKELKDIFAKFVKEYLKVEGKPHLVDKVSKVMAITYDINVKSGKTPNQACIISIAIAIKALADNTLESKDITDLNEVVAKSKKSSFWSFIFWFFSVVLALIVGGLIVANKYESMTYVQRQVFSYRSAHPIGGLIVHTLFPVLTVAEFFIGIFTNISVFNL